MLRLAPTTNDSRHPTVRASGAKGSPLTPLHSPSTLIIDKSDARELSPGASPISCDIIVAISFRVFESFASCAPLHERSSLVMKKLS